MTFFEMTRFFCGVHMRHLMLLDTFFPEEHLRHIIFSNIVTCALIGRFPVQTKAFHLRIKPAKLNGTKFQQMIAQRC